MTTLVYLLILILVSCLDLIDTRMQFTELRVDSATNNVCFQTQMRSIQFSWESNTMKSFHIGVKHANMHGSLIKWLMGQVIMLLLRL